MPDTAHTDNAIEEIEDTDAILTKIPVQIIALNREGHYVSHATKNFHSPYNDKVRALLSTYFRFYKIFTTNNICTDFVQKLREDHNEIYLFLIKIFESVTEGAKFSEEDGAEIRQLLDGILEHNISDFNVFTSIEVYKLIKSEQDKFIGQQEALQKEHRAIVDKFENTYSVANISTYSKKFSQLLESETTAKKWWLGLLTGCSVIILCYFGVNIYILQQTYDLKITDLVIYLPFTALAFLILTWLGRRYAACREQEITYQHLTTILSTYKDFQANLDDTNKGLLILETARVVTAIPKPLAKESPSIDYSKVVDILKIMNKKE